MPLSAGEKLGPYQILAQIGKGGMGEVYRAIDTRLRREVAVKVSSEQFSERFEREARAVAALNHPNICTLHDVGPNYLVMEHVDGSPVAPQSDVRKLLDLAIQIADGMAAAHNAGFVHRDLKPENILVNREGRVKILDFGLAKRAGASVGEDKPTQTIRLTDPGSTVGTAAYMSPEQARGEQNLGPQSDQFSFGLVLYEMATGHSAFRRNTRVETMTAIIREDAEQLPATLPPPLRWVIERLLAKDPADRYDSSRDLHRELRHIRERLSEAATASQAVPPAFARRRYRLTLFAVAALALAALGVALSWFLVPRARPPDLSRYRFTILSGDPAMEWTPAWSPDGKSIVYSVMVRGMFHLRTKTIGSSQFTQLTHGAGEPEPVSPFWSPDGSRIYFDGQGGLWVVGAAGGNPERILDGVTGPAAIHPDGKTFAFVRDEKLWIGGEPRAGGQSPREFGKPPFDPPGQVQAFSPDGSKLAIIKNNDLWILAYPSGEARKLPLKSGRGSIEQGPLRGGSWMPDSRHLAVTGFDSPGNLFLIDTQEESWRMVYTSPSTIISPGVSPDGTRIAFASGPVTWNLVEVTLPEGDARMLPSSSVGISVSPAWAPSGNHYAFSSRRSGASRIEDVTLVNGGESVSRTLVTLDFGAEILGWSPDGTRLLLHSYLASGEQLMLSNSSGGNVIPLDDKAAYSRSGIWSPDSQWVAYVRRVAQEGQLVRLRPGSSTAPEILKKWPLPDMQNQERAPLAWSPDGKWMLASWGNKLCLLSPDASTERILASSAKPFFVAAGFSRDGSQVLQLFHNRAGAGAEWQLLSIDVATGNKRMLAGVNLPPTIGEARSFSLHPDGKRFLTSVSNWSYDIWMLEGFDGE